MDDWAARPAVEGPLPLAPPLPSWCSPLPRNAAIRRCTGALRGCICTPMHPLCVATDSDHSNHKRRGKIRLSVRNFPWIGNPGQCKIFPTVILLRNSSISFLWLWDLTFTGWCRQPCISGFQGVRLDDILNSLLTLFSNNSFILFLINHKIPLV